MSFGQAISSGFKNYAVVQGRSTRSAFWFFYLFVVIVGFAITLIEGLLLDNSFAGGFGIISTIWFIVIFIPTVSVVVRRLHDTNRSGWWWWIQLVPFVGFIVILVFMVSASSPGENKYGPETIYI